jgi:spore germination cell wall hydrolase CwlJ-like protein
MGSKGAHWPLPNRNEKLRLPIRTRAYALALNVGVLAGAAFGVFAFSGAAQPAPSQASAYAAAAKKGFDSGRRLEAQTIVVTAPPKPRTLDCLAAAVYYEARGESAAGRAAVAQVVLNRTGRAGFPKTVCAVVYQGARAGDCQFSFVCNGAMNGPRERLAWLDARRIAARALEGYVMADVGKAVSFHVAGTHLPPGGVRLGAHVFFT